MKRLKIGEALKTKEDVKDLIINLIERTNEFPAIFIKDLTKKYAFGSPLKLQGKEIDEMVDLVLYDMQMDGSLICNGGMFVRIKVEAKSL